MTDVLIDTSTLLDLVLCYQKRHRRNRSVASSAATAIESIIIYKRPLVDASSVDPIASAHERDRFLTFYCDSDAKTAIDQFRSLISFCGRLELPVEQLSGLHNQALAMVESSLGVIEDTTDLRAYELYDYLPYHLGEDPTAIECKVADPSVVDIESLDTAEVGVNDYWQNVAKRLKKHNHPTRAAWSLPLWRLFYYQAMQNQVEVHYVPHATKSTLAFGREAETVSYRRLLHYSDEVFRKQYLAQAQQKLGGLMIPVPVPAIAEVLLRKTHDWDNLIHHLKVISNDPAANSYKLSLCEFIDELKHSSSLVESQADIENAFNRLEQHCQEWAAKLGLGDKHRTVRVALSFCAGNVADDYSNRFMLIHNLYSATGIAQTGNSRLHLGSVAP